MIKEMFEYVLFLGGLLGTFLGIAAVILFTLGGLPYHAITPGIITIASIVLLHRLTR